MVGGAARDNVDAIDQVELGRRHVQLVDNQRASDQAAGQRIADDAGLLVNLLQHEVGVAALFGDVEIPIDMGDVGLNGVAGLVVVLDAIGAQARHLPVGEHHHITRGVDHRNDVGGHVAAGLAAAHHDGGILAAGDDRARLGIGHDGQAVGADEPRGRLGHRRTQVAGAFGEHAVIGLLHEVRHHLGIRLALEDVPAADELLAQLGEVLDDAVVHHGDVAGARGVRVRVGLARLAVGGPTGVPDAAGARHFEVAEGVRELGHLALAGDHLNAAVLLHGHTRRVVAAVFHAGEPLHQDGRGARLTGIADDSAHRCSFIESGRHEAALTHLPVRYCTEGAPSPAAFHEKPVSTAAGSSGNTGCSDRASSAANRTGLNVLSCRARTA